MVTSFRFRDVKDSFQFQLSEDIRKIKSSPNVFVFAYKTSSNNKISKDHHQKVLHDNTTKTYQKALLKLEASINLEVKIISTMLEIRDRVERVARAVTKLKNLSDVHLMLLGAVENDFQLVIQKESYEIANDH